MNEWKGYGPDNLLHADAGVTEMGASTGRGAGTLTYEPYYGLKTKPFSLSTDPRAFYTSPSHAAVLEDLLGAIRRREGLIVLTGEMGTGKTTLCRAALYQLDRKTFTTFVPDPSLSREDLLRMLLVGFGEVSVDDLKRGRLKGTPRADLGCQLFEFLTSLESVDAFAVLVIDEAQHLAPPLLDEIRALSELEAGRQLLQIVLVGQPELRSRLKLPELRQIEQRVMTSCELRPLSRDGVGGYVSHRLAAAGGARDRLEFSVAALDLVYTASGGIPRLVNRICDRALNHGYLDHSAHIGQGQVEKALRDLDLAPVPKTEDRSREPRAESPDTTISRGLFERKTTTDVRAPLASDLNALLDLPVASRQTTAVPPSVDPVRTTAHQRSIRRKRAWLQALRALSLPILGMTVMLLAGVLAVSLVGPGLTVALPAAPLPPRLVLPAVRRPAPGQTNESLPPPSVTAAAVPAASVAPPQTWVVQVAAFASPDRASAMVRRLLDSGLPAYQADADLGARGRLTMVRVGPYQSARDADNARAQLRAGADFDGAFVRNITAVDP